MSENRVNVDDVAVTPTALNLDPAAVTKTLETALKVAGAIAKVTQTEVDDNVVAALQSVVGQPWFAEVLSLVLNLVNDGKSGQEIAAAVAAAVGKSA